MSQFTLRRVDPVSVAKIAAVVQASIGLLIGACISLVAIVAGAASNAVGAPAWVGPLFGVGAVIAVPIFYGVIGFIGGLIGAAIYNFFAGVIGGVVLEFDGELVQQ